MSSNNDGLSLRYRITWRLTWLLLHVAGPADLGDADPRRRMERERAERAARARAAREVAVEPTAEVRSGITPPTAPDQPFTGAA